ncbi:MAG: DUF1735 domain-containing protein [Bacteroidetes bacterium]|nr:DUF1735 domain-containing protein [Bacteroidota bacterium]
MKRLINIKWGLIGGVLLCSSCLKNNGPVQDYSQSPALVSIQGDGQYSGIYVTSQSVLPVGTASASVEVALSVAGLTLSTPVTATLVVDQATLDQYKAENSDPTRLLLPADNYQIANNGAVTISPGQQIVKDSITFFGNKIDFTKDYALPLLLTDGKGARIPDNLKQEVILVKLKSIYEDTYNLSGSRILYNGATVGSGVLATAGITGSAMFSTVSPNVIDGQLADLTSQMSLQINPDNSVTVLPSQANAGNSFASVANDGTCTYNPATKTFTLHYKYYNGAGNLRHIDEVMVGQ